MKISYYTVDGNLDVTNGYGKAGFEFIRALQKAGHEVPFDDEEAPIQISFCQPTHYKFHEGQYKIGYTPWESTELPHGWLEKMNACDEVWATSVWVQKVYERAGVNVPIKVVHHGLDPKWTPLKREVGDVTNFFHHGEPALRKGGQMALDAFRAVFGDREDVHLTFKANSQHYLRAWHDGKFSLPEYNNVTIITTLMHENELVDLYHKMDCMVYPSYGEGFGLIPLQALGTGMPVISPTVWAPYERWIDFGVKSYYNRSVWPVHPGEMLFPDFRHLKYLLELFQSDKGYWLNGAYNRAELVHEDFNWETIAKDVSSHLEKVLENR